MNRRQSLARRWNDGANATRAYQARLAELIEPGMRLLHAGCGRDKIGVSSSYADRCTVIGLDLDSRVAKQFHSDFVLGSVSALPFENAAFDAIFSEYVFEHVREPAEAFLEAARVLRPGGRMVILTPNRYSYKSLAAALTPYSFHLAMGRIRYGRGHDADIYPTLYRCNTVSRFRRYAADAGLRVVDIQRITNGPTWFVKFPILFELFDLFHRVIERWRWASALRCALVVVLAKG